MESRVSALICIVVLASPIFSATQGKYKIDHNKPEHRFCADDNGKCTDRNTRVLPTYSQADAEALAQQVFVNLQGSQYYCKSKVQYTAEAIANDGYFFCKDYVDYAAACDGQQATSCNNTWAIEMHQKFKNTLKVYSCGTYSSIWTCSNCSDAYKRWLCSITYRKHIIPSTEETETGQVRSS